MVRRYQDRARLKNLLAQECARLIVEEGVQSFQAARHKAAFRLAISNKASLPNNAQIEQALLDYQRLFHATQQSINLRRLRETAVTAMRFLANFRPKLVGPVLSGTAGPHTDIQLHLFADSSKDVLMFLMENHIPLETSTRRFKTNNDSYISIPVFRFSTSDIYIDLTVFGPLDEREAPRSPIDGRPLRRASLLEIESLLASD